MERKKEVQERTDQRNATSHVLLVCLFVCFPWLGVAALCCCMSTRGDARDCRDSDGRDVIESARLDDRLHLLCIKGARFF